MKTQERIPYLIRNARQRAYRTPDGHLYLAEGDRTELVVESHESANARHLAPGLYRDADMPNVTWMAERHRLVRFDVAPASLIEAYGPYRPYRFA
jgi:hypothetical protein